MAKVTQVWNSETRRFEAKEAITGKRGIEVEKISILASQFGNLIDFAKEDGLDLKGETEQGSKAKITRAVQKYVEIALYEFIDARNKVA